MKNVVENNLGHKYYLDDFKFWYISENEEVIDLAYKFCPNDEFNKNLVLLTLQVIDDTDDTDDEISGDE